MRRVVIGVALLSVLVAAGSAVAGSSGRTVERTYQAAETDPSFPQGGVHSYSSVRFRPRAGESRVMVSIQDQSGRAVPAAIEQDADGGRDIVHHFCGSTARPVAIASRAPVEVVRYHGFCDDDPSDPTRGGAWTTGTVTATFSK